MQVTLFLAGVAIAIGAAFIAKSRAWQLQAGAVAWAAATVLLVGAFVDSSIYAGSAVLLVFGVAVFAIHRLRDWDETERLRREVMEVCESGINALAVARANLRLPLHESDYKYAVADIDDMLSVEGALRVTHERLLVTGVPFVAELALEMQPTYQQLIDQIAAQTSALKEIRRLANVKKFRRIAETFAGTYPSAQG